MLRSLLVLLLLAFPSTSRAQTETAASEASEEASDEAPEEANTAARTEAAPEAPEGPPRAPDLAPAIVVVTLGSVLVVGSAFFFGFGAVEGDAVVNAPMDSAWADYRGRLEAANGLFTAGGAAAGLGLGMIAVGSIVLSANAGRDARVAVGPGVLMVRGTF